MRLPVGVGRSVVKGEGLVDIWTLELPLVEPVESGCPLDRWLLKKGIYSQGKLGFGQEDSVLWGHWKMILL